MRREFPNRIRLEIVHRAMNAAGRVTCEGCGLVLGHRPYEIDHVIAEALVVDKSVPLTAADGQLLGVNCCHRGGRNKTATDAGDIARAKRREAKHRGAYRPANPMPGSKASRFRKRMDGTVEIRR